MSTEGKTLCKLWDKNITSPIDIDVYCFERMLYLPEKSKLTATLIMIWGNKTIEMYYSLLHFFRFIFLSFGTKSEF